MDDTAVRRYFTQPTHIYHRRYEALRAVIVEGRSQQPGYLWEFRHWWRPRLLPPDASWLNQAEMLLEAFEERYLKRGSWRSREECQAHIAEAWSEYNRLYAHPFEWEWTIPQMKHWLALQLNSLQDFWPGPLGNRGRAILGLGGVCVSTRAVPEIPVIN